MGDSILGQGCVKYIYGFRVYGLTVYGFRVYGFRA